MSTWPFAGSSSYTVRRWAALRLVLGIALLATLLAYSSTTARAQTTPEGGITVVGNGEASAPAETASLQLLITRGDSFGGPPPAPRPGATPGAEERELLAPIVEAIVAQGIDEANVAVIVSPVSGDAYYGPGGPSVGRIDVAIDQPTRDGLTTFLGAVGLAAADQRLSLGQAGIAYEVADCPAVERQAREAAIADAQARAATQAELLGVEIGPVTASSDLPGPSYFGVPLTASGCAPQDITAFAIDGPSVGVTFPPFDPSAEPEVEVYVQISLTFAIAQG